MRRIWLALQGGVLAFLSMGNLSANAATDYYWTGAAGDGSLTTPGNWANAQGVAMTTAPGTASYLVFTNTSALSFKAGSSDFKAYGYRFEGTKNVSFGSGKDYWIGEGGISNLMMRSRVDINYVTHYPNAVFDYYVGGASTNATSHTIKRGGSNTVIQKTGSGTVYLCTNTATNPGVDTNMHFRIVEGELQLGRTSYNSEASPNTGMTLEFVGDKPKTVGFPMAHWYLGTGSRIVETDVTTTHHYISDDGMNRIITFCGTLDDIRFTGGFGGIIAVRWKPANDATLTLAKGVSTSTGSFYVDRGVVRFTEGARYNDRVYYFTVADGAQFRLEDERSVFRASNSFGIIYSGGGRKPLYLAKGAVLLYYGAADKATYNGVQLTQAVYTQHNCDWIDGEGCVILKTAFTEPAAATTAIWTGNGGADTRVTNPANWGTADNTTLPDLSTGSLEADFAVGQTATIPEGTVCLFRKMTFSSSSAFALKKEDGGWVQLGSGGISIPPSAGTCQIECPMVLVSNQTWVVSNTLTLASSASLACIYNGGKLTKIGSKSLIVRSGTNYISDVTLESGGADLYADDGLGDARSTISVKGTSSTHALRLHGVRVSSALKYPYGGNGNNNGLEFLDAVEGENVLCGKVTSEAPNEQFYNVRNGASLRFQGGINYASNNNGALFSPKTSGTHVPVYIENTPLTGCVRTLIGYENGSYKGSIAFHLGVASNYFVRGLHLYAHGRLFTEVPDALYAKNGMGADFGGGVRFYTGGVWDLCGNDQGVNVLCADTPTGVITSATDAVVHLRDDCFNTKKNTENAKGPGTDQNYSILYTPYTQVNCATFAGGAGLVKEGALTNWLMGASTTTGRLVVAKGRLVLTRAEDINVLPDVPIRKMTGSWTNASEVVVSGGVLELEHRFALGEATAVKFSGSGKMEINADGMQRVGSVSVFENGTWRDLGNGTYTAANLPAYISGRGALRVGIPGCIVIFR